VASHEIDVNFSAFAMSRGFRPGRWYAGLAVVYLVLVIYGSLVPLHFQRVPWDVALERWRQDPLMPLKIYSLTDFAANVLLFVPLAFLWMGALSIDRPWPMACLAGLIVVVLCAALSSGIEFTQIFFPPRTTSSSDIVGETTGGILGTVAWLAFGPVLMKRLRHVMSGQAGRGLVVLLLVGYLLFLALVQTTPLDLTLSPVEIVRKYRRGMINLVPFASFRAGLAAGLAKAFWNAAFFFPIGVLLLFLPTFAWNKETWRPMLYAGLTAAAGLEFLQLFVLSRHVDATDIVTGALGVLAGWFVAGFMTYHDRHSRIARFLHGPSARTLAFAAWLGMIALIHWQPFDFHFDRSFLAARWRALSFVPFADYQSAPEYSAFDQILQKIFYFFPFGALLASVPLVRSQRHAWILAAAAGAIVAAIFELGQLALPERYASISDVLVETFGTWLGFQVVRQWHRLDEARGQTGRL
jgi:glycopeptide antibiotics resistance protein